MVNVAHSTLTGSELHEPKGADAAALGTVYVANGAGSGSWSSIGTSAFTGMIADFPAPFAPTGWLELDGSIISTATYSGLFAVLSATTSGTRTNGSPIITSIPSTTGYVAGYYVFGTGFASGLTILSVDSPTQITLTGNAGSSGTSALFVSPFLMNTGTITLPDVKTNARYRRSRGPGVKVGDALASQNLAHTHGSPLTTSGQSVSHTHTYSGTTGNQSASHTHDYTGYDGGAVNAGGGAGGQLGGTHTTGIESANHTHTYSGTSANNSVDHTHTVTVASDGGTEARPLTLVVMTCIKT